MTGIVSERYEQEYTRLAADPIVKAMAVGLAGVPRSELVHDDGETPRHEFMLAAMREYHARGGTQSESIGGVAHALLRVLDEPSTCGNRNGNARCFRPTNHDGRHRSAMGCAW